MFVVENPKFFLALGAERKDESDAVHNSLLWLIEEMTARGPQGQIFQYDLGKK
uniref:Uncharacterized protein n=1 Tax=Romanomermis culicivorax TaxID=13658 RepID=A0A915I0E8_ROMCU